MGAQNGCCKVYEITHGRSNDVSTTEIGQVICDDDGLFFPSFEVKSWYCDNACATFCLTDDCESSFYGGVPGQETQNDNVEGLGIVAIQVKKEKHSQLQNGL